MLQSRFKSPRKINGLATFSAVRGTHFRILLFGNGLQKMNRFGVHGAGKNMVHLFAGHGRHGMNDTAIHGRQHDVLVAVVNHQGPFGADEFDRRGRKIGIRRRHNPAGADGQHRAIVHGHDNPHAILDAMGRPHHLVHRLGVNANRFRRLQTPENEV